MIDVVFKGIDDQVTTYETLDDEVLEKLGAWYRGDAILSDDEQSLLD